MNFDELTIFSTSILPLSREMLVSTIFRLNKFDMDE